MIHTFATRIMSAIEKEQSDTATLEQEYRCVVTPFGQGQLPDEVRKFLHAHPEAKNLYVRWLPDLMVIRPALYLAGIAECAWLVDSKAGRQDTSFWSLEKAAHAAHRLQRIALGLPIVYIWPDGCSCSYVEDWPDEELVEGSWMGYGSGTPWWKVYKKLTRPLDEVFGKGIPA